MITRIESDALPELSALFARCFDDDAYYQRMFPGAPGRRGQGKRLERLCAGALRYCVESGGAYGMRDEAGLCAFILYFDYQKLKRTDRPLFYEVFTGRRQPGELPYKAALHDRMNNAADNMIFLLSLGVRQDARRQGRARRLLDFLLDNHPNHYIAGDVSNKSSLPLYEARGFVTERLDNDYWLVMRAPQIDLSQRAFAGDEQIPVLLPHRELVRELPGGEALVLQKTEISGYALADEAPYAAFVKRPDAACAAYATTLSYKQLLALQRYCNLACCTEACILSEGEARLLYPRDTAPEGTRLWNGTLRDMVKTRLSEWNIIADVKVSIPVEYESLPRLEERVACWDEEVGAFLRCLDYRTHYEAGVPKDTGERAASGFQGRIRRYYLGKLTVMITQESTLSTYGSMGGAIGAPAQVDMLFSADKSSRCGVFTLLSQSAPFLISHLFDNIIRNQLYVLHEGAWIGLYAYMERRFGLFRRGTPKINAFIPQERDCLTRAQIASLLMAETIYDADEALGSLMDPQLLAIAGSPLGMGQYDRSFVCAHTNVFLEFCGHFRASVRARLQEEAITFLYIELLLFEEAAIQIASHRIAACLNDTRRVSTMRFLRRTLVIHRDYAKTIDFWDIQVNYPSSRTSVSMLRQAFRITDQLSRMKRDAEELRAVFETRRDIADRTEASLLNYIILFLTLIQGSTVLMPSLFTGSDPFSPGKLVGSGIIICIMLLCFVLKRHIGNGRRYR